MRLQRIKPTHVLVVMVTVWALLLIVFAIGRHERLNSSAYDLAIKSQVIWNTYQGRFFASSIEVENYLGDHVQPIMLLLAPLFGLWEDVNVLLVVQAMALSLGAIPVFRIARRNLSNDRLALLFGAAYLLYPTIGFVNRFDFHPLTLVVLFLLLAVDFVETDRPILASFFVLLSLMSREDVGFTVFALGLYVAFVERQRALGLIWAFVALAWSLLAIFAVIPFFRGQESDTIGRYAWLGTSIPEIMQTLLTRPGFVLRSQFGESFRLLFIVKLLLPVGFLALLSPFTLAIILPALTYNLLSETPSQSSIYFQYISPIIPFIFLAAIKGAARIQSRLPDHATNLQRTLPVACLLAVGILLAWILDNPFTKRIDEPYFPVYAWEQYGHRDSFAEAKRLVPEDASVATMMNYAPHLALRQELHLFYDRLRLEERAFGFPQSDYLLLNLSDLRWGVNARLFYAGVETAVGRWGFEAIYFKDDVALLTQTAIAQPQTGYVLQRAIELNESGGKFAPTAQSTLDWMGQQWILDQLPSTASHAIIDFESGVRLLGHDPGPNKSTAGRPYCITLYWQTEEDLQNSYTIFVHLVDEDGYVHAQRDSTPALGFRPTTSWNQEEILADMHCFQLPPGLLPGRYGINAGVYSSDTGERLQIASHPDQAPIDFVRLAEVVIMEQD